MTASSVDKVTQAFEKLYFAIYLYQDLAFNGPALAPDDINLIVAYYIESLADSIGTHTFLESLDGPALASTLDFVRGESLAPPSLCL